MMYETVVQLVTGEMSFKYVSGPVGTSTVISDAAKSGVESFLNLVALLSLNLGVMNLLPLPALDGGRFIFLMIELIFRRPVPKKFEAVVHFVGLILLFGLMIAVMFKDIFFPIQ